MELIFALVYGRDLLLDSTVNVFDIPNRATPIQLLASPAAMQRVSSQNHTPPSLNLAMFAQAVRGISLTTTSIPNTSANLPPVLASRGLCARNQQQFSDKDTPQLTGSGLLCT